MTEDFDFDKALADLRAGGDLTGKDGLKEGDAVKTGEPLVHLMALVLTQRTSI